MCCEVWRKNNEWATLSESEQKGLSTAANILGKVAQELYFGSGAYSLSSRSNDEITLDEQVLSRFLIEFKPTLELLATVGIPSLVHHLLELLNEYIEVDPSLVFRLCSDALEAGKDGGYQYEQLGQQLFVSIVSRYIADFPEVFSSSDEARGRLISSIGYFVDAGWPDARELAYELPELLR